MKASLAALALLFSGGVQASISPPLGWTFLHVVSWVPAFWVFSRLEGRRAFCAGWLLGTSANAAIFYWIAGTVGRFSSVPSSLSPLVLAFFAALAGLYAAVFAWGFGSVRRAAGRWWPLGVAAWFTAVEFLNPQMFPYFQGVAWYRFPAIFLVTALTGVSGVTFLVILCNGVVFQAVEEMRGGGSSALRAWATNAGVLVALVACAFACSAVRLARIESAEAEAESLRVALVQPNYDVVRRREMRRKEPGVFARDLVALSREAARQFGRIDVFVWPEGALAGEPRAPRNGAVLEFVRETGAEVWTGANVSRLGADGLHWSTNSAFRIFGDGVVDERYDKNILVPFGEFMPLADEIPALRKIRGPGNFARGQGLSVHDGGLARVAFLICYEAIRSGYVREAVRQDPDLLVNLTFDAWFGKTSEPDQHLMLSAIQAAQYGLPLLRSTTTGISAFVDARGRITAQTGVFTREVLVRDVKKVRIPSFYARAGDWFAWACACFAAGLLAAGLRRRTTSV
jgi:apolipoprotein N-acyltransferase